MRIVAYHFYEKQQQKQLDSTFLLWIWGEMMNPIIGEMQIRGFWMNPRILGEMNWDVIQIGMELNVEEGYFGADIKLSFSTCL